MSYRVVWFKRDLRVQDHWPLHEAARRGPVLCLYVVEPSLWAQPDAAAQHYGFVHESLQALDAQLQRLGSRLHVAVGEVVDVLAALHAAAPFEAVHAHEETGNAHTFARDLAVGRWCRQQGVGWQEWPQFGVVRRLRDTWLFEPWRMSADVAERCGVRVGQDIAVPPVELMDALRASKTRMHALRRQPAVRAAKAAVVERHGSRRGMPGASRDAQGEERVPLRRQAKPAVNQMTLEF